MTTKELIAELNRLDPSGEAEIRVPVKTHTQVYPHGYFEPFSVDRSANTVRIYISLGEGFSISKRKAKGGAR
jgi:hypothetical protein